MGEGKDRNFSNLYAAFFESDTDCPFDAVIARLQQISLPVHHDFMDIIVFGGK